MVLGRRGAIYTRSGRWDLPYRLPPTISPLNYRCIHIYFFHGIFLSFLKVKKNFKIKVSSKTEEVIKELGKLNRQMYSKVLGKEMERLCEGLPIVLVTPGNLNDIKRANDRVQESDEIQEKASASKRTYWC